MRPCVTLQLPTVQMQPLPLDGATALLIGHGYVAHALQPALQDASARVLHTCRKNGDIPFGTQAMRDAFAAADIVMVSVPPGRDGTEPTLNALAGTSTEARWIGYLSATSVYGDRNGQWAYEGEAPTPGLVRGRHRADAELAWLTTYPQTHIFRLAGIYGPGRAPFERIRSGRARIIDAPGPVVNRIHRHDIVSALLASLAHPSPQDIYNIADGNPAPPGEVLAYAASLIGATEPKTVSLSDPSVSDMARSFYAESKRVDISRARSRLGWVPRFRTYREGLTSVLAHAGHRQN